MNKVAVVTDSAANLPQDVQRQLNIHVVPLDLIFRGHTYYDGVDVTPGELYRWLRANKQIPTTSAPSIGDFLRVYASIAAEAAGIVSIHVTARLSATYTAALAASQLVDGVTIRVISSETAAMAEGFVVLEAARVAAAGGDIDAVVARALEVAPKTNLFATVDTLEYLHRGGRIGGAAALAGTMLQLKPVVYVADGHVEAYARPRTKARAVRLMLKAVAERAGANGQRLHAAILHADVPQEAEELRQRVAEQFDCAELYVTEFTPVMGAHTGPGLLGVAFYVE